VNALRIAGRVTGVSLVACLALLSSGHAVTPGTTTPRLVPVPLSSHHLGISVPASADLGSGPAGGRISGQLGPVTVSGSAALLGGWTASVTLTSAFRVSQGDQTWHLPNDRVLYASGAATSTSGIGVNVCLPGQATDLLAQPLTSTRTAYSCGAILSLSSSLTWQPTLIIQGEPTDPAGTYTGTITHSVA
jgi:hypothetical protein